MNRENAKRDCQVVLTTHKYHAAELAYSLDLNSVDGAVCVGGDGLFNEFYNGLLLRKVNIVSLL